MKERSASPEKVGSGPCPVTGGESVDDLLRHGRHRLHRPPPGRAPARARGRHLRASSAEAPVDEARARSVEAAGAARRPHQAGHRRPRRALPRRRRGAARRLRGTIDHFFHLAAIYDMAADETRNALLNVGGTQHAIDLANDARGRHVPPRLLDRRRRQLRRGHVQRGHVRRGPEARPPVPPHEVRVREARPRTRDTSPWRIYRPSIVVGDSRTGEMDKIDGPYYFFKLIQKIRHTLPEWFPLIGARVAAGPTSSRSTSSPPRRPHRPRARTSTARRSTSSTRKGQRAGDVLNTFAAAGHAPQAVDADRQAALTRHAARRACFASR